MLQAIKAAIDRHRLIEPGSTVLIAISGGADSSALAHLLCRLRKAYRLDVFLVHVHHGIRIDESDRDVEFVTRFAEDLGCVLQVEYVDVPSLAKTWGVSLEMAARRARQEVFLREQERVSAASVATAHHADDQAETLLLRVLRGTGLDGLGGIRPKRSIGDLRLISPLLGVSRLSLQRYLEEQGLEWREDLSNLDTSILRNRVRGELLPMLEDYAGEVRVGLSRLAATVAEDLDWIKGLVGEAFQARLMADGALDVVDLAASPLALQRRVVRAWLLACGVDAEVLTMGLTDRVLDLALRDAGGGEVPAGGGASVRRDRQKLYWVGADAPEGDAWEGVIAIPGSTRLEGAGVSLLASMQAAGSHDAVSGPGAFPAQMQLSLEALGGRPLIARSFRDGDRMRPLALGGSKKVQDIFVDEHLARDRRIRVPILVCEGQIVGIPGYRVAEGWGVELGAECLCLAFEALVSDVPVVE